MSTQTFPSPIGGVPFPHDFTPSLIFALLYFVVAQLALYRMISKSSRTLVILGTVIFSAERIVDFALRALEAKRPNIRTSSFFVDWLQGAYAMGYLSATQDLCHIARIFVLKITRGSGFTAVQAPDGKMGSLEALPLTGPRSVRVDLDTSYDPSTYNQTPYDPSTYNQTPYDPTTYNPTTYRPPTYDPPVWPRKEGETEAGVAMDAGDHVEYSKPAQWLKRLSWATLALRLAAIALSAVSSGLYFQGINNKSTGNIVQLLRYMSAIIALSLQFLALFEVIWALVTHPRRTPRGPALYLCAMVGVIMIPSFYRLAAMDSYTTSLLSMGPGSLNGPTAKALFYSLHVAPEWVSAMMLLGVNVRTMYGVGFGLKG